MRLTNTWTITPEATTPNGNHIALVWSEHYEAWVPACTDQDGRWHGLPWLCSPTRVGRKVGLLLAWREACK